MVTTVAGRIRRTNQTVKPRSSPAPPASGTAGSQVFRRRRLSALVAECGPLRLFESVEPPLSCCIQEVVEEVRVAVSPTQVGVRFQVCFETHLISGVCCEVVAEHDCERVVVEAGVLPYPTDEPWGEQLVGAFFGVASRALPFHFQKQVAACARVADFDVGGETGLSGLAGGPVEVSEVLWVCGDLEVVW